MPIGALLDPGLKAAFQSAGYDLSSFTDEEQRCISAKISKLRDEGKPQDQSVAIAISMCSPSKSKSGKAGSFEADPNTQQIKIEGGNYKWSRETDGTFIIYDVPIFTLVDEGVKGAPKGIDEEYLENVVKIAQERYRIGKYAPRLFINHHREPVELNPPIFSGYALPNRVGPHKVEKDGKFITQPTIFANFKANAETFEKIKKGELPGVSVELPWETKRISGVALLGTRSPFFEFPNLTIGEEIPSSQVGSFQAVDDPEFKPKEIDMTKEELDALVGKFSSIVDEKLTAAFAAKNWPGKTGKMDDKPGESKVEEEAEGEGEGGKEKKAKMMAKKKKAKLDGEGEADGEAEAEGKKGKDKGTFEDQDREKDEVLPVEGKTNVGNATMDSEKVAGMFASYDAKIAALEADKKKRDEADRKREEDEKRKARVLQAESDLKGYILSEDWKTTFTATFAGDDKTAKAYVESMKKNAQKEPPATMEDFKGVAVAPTDPKVAKFANLGPEAVEKAGIFAAQYRQNGALRKMPGMTEEKYVELCLGLDSDHTADLWKTTR